MRAEGPRIRLDVADLGRSRDLPFRVALCDFLPLGDVACADPFPGAGIAVAKREELEAGMVALSSRGFALGFQLETACRRGGAGLGVIPSSVAPCPWGLMRSMMREYFGFTI